MATQAVAYGAGTGADLEDAGLRKRAAGGFPTYVPLGPSDEADEKKRNTRVRPPCSDRRHARFLMSNAGFGGARH